MARVESLVTRIESVLPQRCRRPTGTARLRFVIASVRHGTLEPVRHIGAMRLDDLQEISDQKEKIRRNTEQFVSGRPANNAAHRLTRNRQVIPDQGLFE
jgi:predicted AAA+ superfamily ATPase